MPCAIICQPLLSKLLSQPAFVAVPPPPSLNHNSIMPVALPPDAAVHHNFEPDATRAYNVCRNFEEHATDNLDVMHARILGYLIIYSPSLTARREVVKVIHSCGNDHPSLSTLGSTFLDYFIRPCEHSAHTWYTLLTLISYGI